MIAFYPQIKLVHVCAVLASGSLFALRGAALLAGLRMAMAAPVRYASYAVDTVLLTAALMLFTLLPGAMFANGWLWMKLALLPAYVALGTLALRRARTPRGRVACYLAALVVFTWMAGMARMHHPLGWLRLLG